VGREWLTAARVQPNGVVQEEFREAARAEPREAAVVSLTPEGKSPITFEPVPPKKCRLRRGSSQGLDRIPYDLANMPDLNHRDVTLRHFTVSRRTLY
jgi:hypothetical protein